jgi:hypothetical protein
VIRRIAPVLWLFAAAILIGACIGLSARANATEPNCQSVPWGFLGSQERLICDDPIQPDGSWMRHRIVGHGSYWTNPSSSCSGGYYYSHCSYDPGGFVPEYHQSDEWYPVRPDTVLPDEPGHLGFTPGVVA